MWCVPLLDRIVIVVVRLLAGLVRLLVVLHSLSIRARREQTVGSDDTRHDTRADPGACPYSDVVEVLDEGLQVLGGERVHVLHVVLPDTFTIIIKLVFNY